VPRMPRLLIKRSIGPAGDHLLTAERYIVGRGPESDIVLDGLGVSRRHAVLRREGETYVVEDLGSHNGVYINNIKTQRQELRDGDRIRVGSHILAYYVEGQSDPLADSAPTIAIEQDYDRLLADLSSTAAAQLSPFDDNAALRRARNERQTLGLLFDLSRSLSSLQSVEEVSRKALEILLQSTPAERGAVFLLQGDHGNLEPVMVVNRNESQESRDPVVLSRTVSERILAERIGIITADAISDPRFAHGPSVVMQGLRSIACAPLVGKGGNRGVLYLENKRAAGAFTNDDLQLLCAVSSQVGLSVENALFFEAFKRANEDLERQVEERTAALRQAELKLYRSEKMASLSRLIAGVAHEMNSPLGALKANLELLTVLFGRLATTAQRPVDEANLVKHMVGIFHDSVSACARIMSVVRSLSSFVRLDEAEFKIASVNDGLRAVVQLLDPSARRRAEVVLRLGDVPPIPCYPALLNEAFMNLLYNACQSVNKSGQVVIETRKEGDQVVVSIRDSRCGIEREHLDKIFDPGFTSKGVGAGVGLGLAVAYSVIKEHNGSIEVVSERGQGSTFNVRLPVSPPSQDSRMKSDE